METHPAKFLQPLNYRWSVGICHRAMKVFLFFPFVFLLTSFNGIRAAEIPIQDQPFAQQLFYLDSIRRTNQGDSAKLVAEFLAIEANAKSLDATQFMNLARLQRYIYYIETNKIFPEIEDWILQVLPFLEEQMKAEALQMLGFYYWRKKDFTSSLESYINAHSIYSQYSIEVFPNKSNYLADYGGAYYDFGDYATAKNYYLEAIEATPEAKLKTIISRINTLALCYDFLEQFDSAEFYFKKAMKLAEDNHDTAWIAIVGSNMADILYKKKEYDKAIELLVSCIDMNKKSNILINAAYGTTLLADIYLIRNEKVRALETALEAYKISLSKNHWHKYAVKKRIFPTLARAYAANGMMAQAYTFLDSAAAAKDSVAKDRNLLFLTGAKHKAEVQKHMAELEIIEGTIKRQKTIRNFLMVGFIVVIFFSIVFLIQKGKIKSEKLRSDKLLLNILPEETAEELKKKGSSEAKSFDEVTVMFTDFKDFSLASEKMSAKDLVAEIHLCYSEFDKIIAKHNIEKIKTIGDSYMCAGGLPVKNITNATDVIRAALEIQKFIQIHIQERANLNLPFFPIRIGIHTGPVVAGIVGIRKFAYDIWGDTVNTASRIETSGEAGRINISGSTYQLVKDRFHCVYRGKIEAKNKGMIDMYFVEGNETQV